MTEINGQAGELLVDELRDHEWTVKQNAAVRALLDHVAEELAAEFVRLMRASVDTEADAKAKEKRQ